MAVLAGVSPSRSRAVTIVLFVITVLLRAGASVVGRLLQGMG
jgi:hypothetical protein